MNLSDVQDHLKRLRKEVKARVVRGTDGGSYLRFKQRSVWCALPADSARAPGLLAKLLGKDVPPERRPRVAKAVLESLRERATLDATPPISICPRIGGTASEIEVLLSANSGVLARVGPSSVTIKKRSRCTFLLAETARSLPVPATLVEPRAVLKKFRALTGLDKDLCILCILWLLACLRPGGPYPILIIQGEAGSGKSSLSFLLKMLLDPSTVMLRALPGSERDLNAAAKGNWILAFDNVSRLTPKVSDALCRLSTGGGMALRRGKGDPDEMVFGGSRPVMLNGIDEFASRDDLLQRSIHIKTKPLDPDLRLTARDWKRMAFEMRSEMLGVLFQSVAHGFKVLDGIQALRRPRMADFWEWAVATGDYFGWSQERITAIYEANQRQLFQNYADNDPAIAAILDLVGEGQWEGSPTELLRALHGQTTRRNGKVGLEHLPKGANALSARLNRGGEALKAYGIEMKVSRNRIGRIIHLQKCRQEPVNERGE